jgi:hypothetical protein
MRTKLIFITLLIFQVIPLFSQAQPGGDHDDDRKDKKEQIDAFKIAFFTERVNFTPQEAQAFWPVYNDFRAKQDAMMHTFRQKYEKSLSNPDQLTDAQANELIDTFTKNMQTIQQLNQSFYTKVRTILSPQKVLKLFEAEKDFKRALLKKMNEPGDDKK